jgi:hypothetical protein
VEISHLKSEELCFTYLHILFETLIDLPLFHSLFTHLFMSFGLMDISFILCDVIKYFFTCCSHFSNFSNLSVCFSVPLTYSHQYECVCVCVFVCVCSMYAHEFVCTFCYLLALQDGLGSSFDFLF